LRSQTFLEFDLRLPTERVSNSPDVGRRSANIAGSRLVAAYRDGLARDSFHGVNRIAHRCVGPAPMLCVVRSCPRDIAAIVALTASCT
jgi:hypothetical protein